MAWLVWLRYYYVCSRIDSEKDWICKLANLVILPNLEKTSSSVVSWPVQRGLGWGKLSSYIVVALLWCDRVAREKQCLSSRRCKRQTLASFGMSLQYRGGNGMVNKFALGTIPHSLLVICWRCDDSRHHIERRAVATSRNFFSCPRNSTILPQLFN